MGSLISRNNSEKIPEKIPENICPICGKNAIMFFETMPMQYECSDKHEWYGYFD